MQKVASDFAGRVKVVKINGIANRQTSGLYGVRGYPTLVIFKNGQQVERMLGMQAQQKLASMLNKHLSQ